MSRMPPPSCTGHGRPLRGCARPPRRSSACRRRRRRDRRCADARKPWFSKACACAAGSRLNTVARAMSPCSRRTHRPSLGRWRGQSGASHGSDCRHRGHHGFHFRKLAISASPSFWLFSGWNCVPAHVVARDDGGDRPAIVGLRHEVGVVGGLELDRSARNRHAGRPARAGCRRAADAAARRRACSSPCAGSSAPGRRRDPVDLARDPAEPVGDLVLAAALGHQLHADADAEERPALARAPSRPAPRPCRARRRARAGNRRRRRRPAARCGRRARTASGSRVTTIGCVVRRFARRALERLGGRVQIAGAVIDDGDAHRALRSGSGNRPITSGIGERRHGAAPEAAPAPTRRGAADRRATQASKKRRSAVFRDRGRPRRRDCSSRAAHRSSAAASPPRSRPAARSASRRRTSPSPDTPSAHSPTCSAADERRR